MQQILQANPLVFYIIAGGGLFTAVHCLFRFRSLRAKMIFLYSASAVSIITFIINMAVNFFVYNRHILELLPLHLCYLSVFFIPAALKLKRKAFYDFVFFIGSAAAFFAIFFPYQPYVDGVFSAKTFTYFSYHFFVAVIPLWMFSWKIYSPKISFKCASALLGVLLLMGVLIHGLNILLINNGIENANYFMTMVEQGRQNNALLALFAAIIPVDFFYMFFAFPILYAYMGIWNLSLNLAQRSVTKTRSAQQSRGAVQKDAAQGNAITVP